MSLVNSKVDICNLALGFLKVNPITNLDTGNSNEEKICSRYFDITRQTVLESANWSFAIKRVELAEDTETPIFGWSAQTAPFPTDYLKLISLHDGSGFAIVNKDNQFYELENNKILSNFSAPYYIKYIADIDDVSKFDKLFIMNLAYSLAVVMSEAFKVSATTLQLVLSKWKDIWESSALTVNAQQTNLKRITRSEYVDIRQQPRSNSIFNLAVEV